jgi:hypothetical protein
MKTGVDEHVSSRGDDNDSSNNSFTTMVMLDDLQSGGDCACTDLQSGGDCARTINSTSTIMVRVRVGGVLLHLLHHPPHPPSEEVTELRSGGDCARTINITSTIMVRVRVGGVLLHLPHPPHPPVFSSAILPHKRKITGFSSVKPPLSSSHNIINVRVHVDGVLVFPDSPDFHSRRRIQEVGGERCSVPLTSECDLYHQRIHLCVSSGASCRTRVGQNVSHHSPPIFFLLKFTHGLRYSRVNHPHLSVCNVHRLLT